MQSLPTATKSGLRGGSGGAARDIKEKPWRLTSLTIIYSGIIASFSFSYIDKSGKKQHIGPWGTDYSNEKTEMVCVYWLCRACVVVYNLDFELFGELLDLIMEPIRSLLIIYWCTADLPWPFGVCRGSIWNICEL